MYILKRIYLKIKKSGFLATIRDSLLFAFTGTTLERKRFNTVLDSNMNMADKFEYIYKKNIWGSSESISGTGSELAATENIRKQLPACFKQYKVERLFDAPCGDFNWMHEVVLQTGVDYQGGDIVGPLINKLNKQYRNQSNISFKQFDITTDSFPSCDLWFSRDCWFHLSYRDIFKALENFVNSDILYVLTTSHLTNDQFINKDIQSGDFREFNLFLPPFNFSQDYLYEIDDWVEGCTPRKMYLFTKQQIQDILTSSKIA